MELICDECGKVSHAIVDGYAVGDTLLEGVRFVVTITGKKVDAAIHPDDADYFASLNQKKWIKQVKEYVKDTDILSCPECEADIENPLFKIEDAPKPIKLQMVTPGSLFR